MKPPTRKPTPVTNVENNIKATTPKPPKMDNIIPTTSKQIPEPFDTFFTKNVKFRK